MSCAPFCARCAGLCRACAGCLAHVFSLQNSELQTCAGQNARLTCAGAHESRATTPTCVNSREHVYAPARPARLTHTCFIKGNFVQCNFIALHSPAHGRVLPVWAKRSLAVAVTTARRVTHVC